jgi:RNA-splicing ligase RtcB
MSNSHQEAQKEAAKEAIKKMQPLINSTSKQAFAAISTTLGKQMNVSRHDICKNIERKLGSKAAEAVYRTRKDLR